MNSAAPKKPEQVSTFRKIRRTRVGLVARTGSILPIAVMAFAVVGFLFVLDYSIGGGKWPWSVNSSKKTVTQTTNTTANVNIETNKTNTSANTNTLTNTAPPASQLEQPIGPFTVGAQPILSAAYYDTTASVHTLVKVNTENGNVIQRATLNLKTSNVVGIAGASLEGTGSIQFGSDGDSIVFESGNIEGMGAATHPYNGLYRTSFSHPEIIEKIIQYDETQSPNKDVAFIASFLYNAESKQVAFVTSDASNPDKLRSTVHITDLNGTERVLQVYPESLSLIGFTNHGQNLNVLKTLYPNGANNNTSQSTMDTLATVDGRVLNSLLIYNNAEIGATGSIDNEPKGIAPNLKNYAYWDDVFGAPRLMFRNLSTKKYSSYSNLDQVNNVFIDWSPDSGKVFLLTKIVSTTPVSGYTKIEMADNIGRYEKYSGKIYDLAKGVIDTIDGAIYPFLWNPGPDIIFQKIDRSIFSYNPVTKKSIELPIAENHETNVSGINWVNR